MKKPRSRSGTIEDTAEAIMETQRLAGQVLLAIARAMANNEKRQIKFRTMVLASLARLQATVTLIHAAQIVEKHPTAESHAAGAKSSNDYISKTAMEIALNTVQYVNSQEDPLIERHDRRRKWSQWEI